MKGQIFWKLMDSDSLGRLQFMYIKGVDLIRCFSNGEEMSLPLFSCLRKQKSNHLVSLACRTVENTSRV
jgi:hypothetical protein